MYKKIKVCFLISVVSFSFMSLCTNGETGSKTELNNTVSPPVVEDEEAISAGLELEQVLRNIAAKVMPAVVDIRIEKKVIKEKSKIYDFFRFFDEKPYFKKEEEGSQNKLVSIGSGFVIGEAGHIITNAHVIEGANYINVVLGEEEYGAKVIGRDAISDIAVIAVEDTKSPLKYLKLDEVDFEVGDLVVAVGNPFGLSGTFTFGVVSAKGRVSLQVDRNAIFKHFIQTDASINRGNSGGPLLNIKGEVIGINTAIYSGLGKSGGSVGIGFAIPVRIAEPIAKELIAKGNIDRGYIGVSIGNLDKNLAEFFKTGKGVIVLWLEKGGPAYRAGLHKGDIIIKVGKKEIKDTSELIGTISSIPPKTKIIITVLRGEKELKFPVILEKRPTNPMLSRGDKKGLGEEDYGNKKKDSSYTREWLGFVFEDLSEKARHLNTKGIVVTDIREGSAAHRATNPLRKGDILESINSYQVHSLEDLDRVIKKLKKKSSFILWLKRGQTEFYSIIKK